MLVQDMKIYQGVRLIFPLNPLDLVCLCAKEGEYIHTQHRLMSSIKENTTIKKESVPKDIAPFISRDAV